MQPDCYYHAPTHSHFSSTLTNHEEVREMRKFYTATARIRVRLNRASDAKANQKRLFASSRSMLSVAKSERRDMQLMFLSSR